MPGDNPSLPGDFGTTHSPRGTASLLYRRVTGFGTPNGGSRGNCTEGKGRPSKEETHDRPKVVTGRGLRAGTRLRFSRMPALTRTQALGLIDKSANRDAAAREMLSSLISGTHPDGTALELSVRVAGSTGTSEVNVTDRAARALGRVADTLAASLAATGTVTAPAAAATIVTLAAPPAGSYRVRVLAGYGGTPSTANNMELRAGAGVLTVLPVLALANDLQETVLERVDLDGATALSVNATALGAAGTIFIAHLSITRVVV